MPDDAPLDEPRFLGDEDRAMAIAHDLAIALHGIEPPLETQALVGCLHAEAPGELFLGDGTFAGKRFEHLLALRDLSRERRQALGFDGQSSVHPVKFIVLRAQMAELVDAPVSGTGG